MRALAGDEATTTLTMVEGIEPSTGPAAPRLVIARK
jgi:hypothetical protein